MWSRLSGAKLGETKTASMWPPLQVVRRVVGRLHALMPCMLVTSIAIIQTGVTAATTLMVTAKKNIPCGVRKTYINWLCFFLSVCLHYSKLTKIWHYVKAIALPNPNKLPDDPKGYRPISLLCIQAPWTSHPGTSQPSDLPPATKRTSWLLQR